MNGEAEASPVPQRRRPFAEVDFDVAIVERRPVERMNRFVDRFLAGKHKAARDAVSSRPPPSPRR